MSEGKKYAGQLVFGLDIGTRSIVGTVGYRSDEHFFVVAQRMKEHDTRAMIDGQIHDIHKVGETIRSVKIQLEEAVGRELTDVCIAAAGRVLRTVNVTVENDFGTDKEMTQEDIYALSTMGMEKAYEIFQQENETDMKFYCVGYSVVRYYINHYPITNPDGHKARVMSADMIATFLPDDVVDGLYKAVGIAGLNVANMTLEPIAASQVAIPEMYRMLNISLVDVGAGTSDISITKDGCIIAFGMIPMAGDALTETIARHCLVDFATAEQIKKSAGEQETVVYKDIMGLEQKISKQEITTVLSPVIQEMTQKVADKIKELNGGKSVSAVFVVGGGGKMEGYTDMLAEELKIQKERVAVRGEEVMQAIEFLEEDVKKDSLLVTPIGICLSFYLQSNNFIFVDFNGHRIKLYDNSQLAVVDAAIQSEFPNEELFPRRGKELNFTVNGKARMVRGQFGEAAVIRVNGEEADIHTSIRAGDRIEVIGSTQGEPAGMELGALNEFGDIITVYVNENRIELPKFANVNGSLQSGYYEIRENDVIELLNYYTVRQIAEFMDVMIDKNMNLYVNNKRADMDTFVYENFSVIWTMDAEPLSDVELDRYGWDDEAVSEAEEKPEKEETEKIAANIPENIPGTPPEAVSIQVMVNGEAVELSGKTAYVYVDVFDRIHFDLSKPRGSSVVTRLNGRQAKYLEPIQNGDSLEIYWKNGSSETD